MPSTHQTQDIDAPVKDVWARLSDFHDFSWAPNVITDCQKVGSVEGREVGAKRVLNNAFHETLAAIDHDKHVLKYSIDDGPSPVSPAEVSNYFGMIKVTPKGDGAHVEWTSTWESDSQDAVGFCHGIYVALLDELAASFAGAENAS